jgi:hypothetical protein
MLVVLCRTVLAFKGRGINIRPVTPNIFRNPFSHQGLKTCARTPLHSSGWSFLLVRLRLHVCSVKATFELGNLTSPTCVLESLVSTPWTCWLIQVLRFWGDNKHILSSSFQEVSCIPNNFIGICHQEFNSFQPKLPCPRLAIETVLLGDHENGWVGLFGWSAVHGQQWIAEHRAEHHALQLVTLPIKVWWKAIYWQVGTLVVYIVCTVLVPIFLQTWVIIWGHFTLTKSNFNS